jgi:hypothetical protein
LENNGLARHYNALRRRERSNNKKRKGLPIKEEI